jgi:hypothetical protein
MKADSTYGFLLAAALLGKSLLAMPLDSTVFVKLNNYDLSTDVRYTIPFGNYGVVRSSILDFQGTIYSDPDANGQIEVDDIERSAAAKSKLTRDRGGNIYLTGTSSIAFRGGYWAPYSGADLFTGTGRFNNGPYKYTGTGQRGWIRNHHATAGVSATTIAQPYAVQTRVVPIGGWDQNDLKAVSFLRGNLTIPPNRVMHFQTLQINYYNNIGTVTGYKKYGGSAGASGIGPTVISGSHKAIEYQLNKPSSSSDGVTNRGFTLIQYLAAECNDGPGIFTGANVGGRTVKAYVNGSTALSSYGGCHGFKNNLYVLESAGDNIWTTGSNYDSLRYAYKTAASGGKTLICRVDQLENTNAWARGGIAIRANTSAGSINVGVYVTPGNGIQFQTRTADKGASTTVAAVAGIKAPVWLKLAYTNTSTTRQVVASRSSDGKTWTTVGTLNTFPGLANYTYGLAAASRSAYPNTSVYSNLSGF